MAGGRLRPPSAWLVPSRDWFPLADALRRGGGSRGRSNPTWAKSRSPAVRIYGLVFLSSLIGGSFSSKNVTLGSIQIFTTHEWLPTRPTVFFQCQGESVTILPDVTKANSLYTFKGEESWQPLTELPDKKCKRCGLYEKDIIKPPDVFDEWEFCSSDFVNGKYIHFKEKEFNATFLCPECGPVKDGSHSSPSESGATGHRISVQLVIIISALVSAVVIAAVVVGYMFWLRRKRQQDQARFLRLFEEGDDIEDELGLGTI